ncbi:MAG: hypothetical protein V3W43_08670 [Desulfatiglandaceae bacterium]
MFIRTDYGLCFLVAIVSTDRKNCPDWINISIGAIDLEPMTRI